MKKLFSKLLRKVENIVPAKILHEIYRRNINAPNNIASELTFKVAETKEELEGAFSLLHDVYVEAGFTDPLPSKIRLLPQSGLISTTVLIAKFNDIIVGTISLIRDNSMGLPLESAFDISSLRRNEYKEMAEVSCFAIRKEWRRQYGGAIFYPFLNFLYNYGHKYFGVNYFLITIYPHHQHFYKAILLFEKLNDVVVEDYYNAPAICMYLNLDEARESTYKKVYSNRKDSQNLYKFFIETQIKNIQYPARMYGQITDHIITPEILRYFFFERTTLFQDMNFQERLTILGQFELKDLEHVMPFVAKIVEREGAPINVKEEEDHSVTGKRIEKRFEVKIKGTLALPYCNWVKFDIVNVSYKGMRVISQVEIPKERSTKVYIDLNLDHKIPISVVPIWRKEQCYGLKIVEKESSWDFFVSSFEEAFNQKIRTGK